jgi:hypothetical protein
LEVRAANHEAMSKCYSSAAMSFSDCVAAVQHVSDLMTSVVSTLRGASVPSRFADANGRLVDAMTTDIAATNDMVSALTAHDASAYQAAAGRYTEANNRVNVIVGEIGGLAGL